MVVAHSRAEQLHERADRPAQALDERVRLSHLHPNRGEAVFVPPFVLEPEAEDDPNRLARKLECSVGGAVRDEGDQSVKAFADVVDGEDAGGW